MSTTGLPLNLAKHVSGFKGWAADMNANLDSINAAIAALQAGGGAVSSVFGRTGAVIAAANDYAFSQLSGIAGLAQGGTNADLSGLGSGCLIYNNAGVLAGDASLKWDSAGKSLLVGGINISTRGDLFEVTSTSTANAKVMALSQFTSQQFFGPTLEFIRARGTQASPSALTSGDLLGYMAWRGWDGSTYAPGVQFQAQGAAAWDATHHSALLSLLAVPAGASGLVEVFRWNSNTDASGDLNANVSALDFSLPHSKSHVWCATDGYSGGADANISWLSAGVLSIGTGASGSFAGTLKLTTLNTVGVSYVGAPASAPTDANLANSQISLYVDEIGNNLKARVKYSNGTLKTATVALA